MATSLERILSVQDLVYLQQVPSTETLRQRLNLYEANPGEMPLARAAGLVRSTQALLREAEVRDMIQQQRPAGCTCLGAGTLGREWCGCPDGIAARAEYEAQQQHARARDIDCFMERAGIPAHFQEMTFASYPDQSSKALAMVRAWRPGGLGLFVWGEFGTGKSGLAVAALREFIAREGKAGLFVVVPALLDQIRESYGADGGKREGPGPLERVRDMPLLVLDDIGAENPSAWVRERLFLLVNHRHGANLPTIFTSNYPLEGLEGRIGERTAWRIHEMSVTVQVAGANLRRKGRLS